MRYSSASSSAWAGWKLWMADRVSGRLPMIAVTRNVAPTAPVISDPFSKRTRGSPVTSESTSPIP